ncbi:hypothetical protein NZL82_11965 [Sphingomonas sanguinis]|jgi:hypothetical protein|uniref:hypothetical protein n=1 Tax=Sphingomonas sp. LC-1 TaxID=3110957 RepID=UPI0021BA491A|nr:hypothetical protein [Sphingomonas sp. LC-1]MCT8002594.1 hypothetical protein [Sphingomonas sp. LC-1]
MKVVRTALVAGVAFWGMGAAAPASAQFFLQSYNFEGKPVRGDEPGIGQPLPGANPAELRAGLLWNMRAALNVAALQCQFEPMLSTVANYNAILKDHDVELKGAFDTLGAYFKRTSKTPREGQMALDQYGTRTYSSFAAVAAQLNFCQTAGSIAHAAVFTPRGHLGELAVERMRELRNSLTPYGEQRFPRYIGREHVAVTMPRLDAPCWNKKAQWVAKKCGAQNWPPAGGTSLAAR